MPELRNMSLLRLEILQVYLAILSDLGVAASMVILRALN